MFAASLLLLGATTAAQAQEGFPEDASSVRVVSALRPEMYMQAGETQTHQLTLENTGNEAVLVNTNHMDFRLDMDGNITFEPNDSLPTSNASWVEGPSQVTVAAASRRSVPLTVHVPTDVEPGTYWSVLFVEPLDATSIERPEGDEGVRATVTVNFRFGVILITHVGQPTERKVLFQDPNLVQDATTGTTSVEVTIENPTSFLMSGDVLLELYDPQGNMVHRVPPRELRVYPRSGRRQTFEVDQLEDQTYQAVIIVDAGNEDVFGVRYDLDLTSE